MKSLFTLWFLVLLALSCQAAPTLAEPISAARPPDGAIGLSVLHLRETNGRLTLAEAAAARRAGDFVPGRQPVLNFGFGARPVWVHLTVDNPAAASIPLRLTLETAWLDDIEVYFVDGDGAVASHRAGDARMHGERPLPGRHFAFEHAFPPGVGEIFLRVETPDPLVLPIHLTSPEAARARETRQAVSYGLVYGFLLALMAYNSLLYVSLRSTRYLLYAFYLATFVAMNAAYTGHGFAWLWPESVRWQAWSNPVLIVSYGIAGLLFAIRFLELKHDFPRLRAAILGLCALTIVLLVGTILAGSQVGALWVAFVFVTSFTGLMLALGIVSVRAGSRPARYFLVAAVAAMLGAALTTLSTWGGIPYDDWTFRAVEIGMLLDATLLALALGYQFRVGQEEKLRAERLAQLDPLTGLDNRRAFYDKTSPLWSNAVRHELATSVMLFDIDHFKRINDELGHARGDEVLKAVADVLRCSVRHGDVAARWGGEEFIVFLPQTDQPAALALAERLRAMLMAMRVTHAAGSVPISASFGVAQRGTDDATLDALIGAADEALYEAKELGRNRVRGRAALELVAPVTA